MDLTSHFYILYGALFLGGALLSVVFHHYYRYYHTLFLALWTGAFAAMAVGYLATGITLANIGTVAPWHPLRLGASLLASIGIYLQILWLILGIACITAPERTTLRRVWIATGLVILLAVTTTLLFAFDSDGADLRIFLRVTLRSLLIGAASLATAIVLYRRGRWRTSFGAAIVGLSFAAFSLNQFILAAATIVRFITRQSLPFGASLSVLDTVAQFAIGMGLVIWLLERERSRAHAAGAEAEFHRQNDQLTRLPNRESVAARLSRLISQSDLRVYEIAVVQIGLDRFKQINSSFGRWAGDELLRELADRLRTLPVTGGFVGRVGSDEFVIIQALRYGDGIIDTLGERVRWTVRQPYAVGDHEVQVDGSVGISLCPRDSDDGELLLKQADLAMQRVKSEGGRGVGFYSPELDQLARQRYRLEQDLHRALTEGQLDLEFQAIVRSRDGAIVGAEALLRWQHPELGLLRPEQFLPVAHDVGLMTQLDAWSMRTALTTVAGWHGPLKQGFTLAVNAAPETFQNPGLETKVVESRAACKCDHIKLEIEITEQTAIADLALTRRRIDALKKLGVEVALDDFGIGYSSLGNLQRLQTPIIKLDRAFVGRIPGDRDATIILEAIVPMLQRLGRRIVAEGVQTAEQARFVQRIGVDYQQGYHHHRPMSSADFQILLDSQRSGRSNIA